MARVDTFSSLAADMLKAAGAAVVGTRAIVQKGALNIKNEAKANVQQSAPIHSAGAWRYISYETEIGKTQVTAEIGYDKDMKPARLGNILEYGTGEQAGHRDLGRALDAEAPRFEDALALFAGKLL